MLFKQETEETTEQYLTNFPHLKNNQNHLGILLFFWQSQLRLYFGKKQTKNPLDLAFSCGHG